MRSTSTNSLGTSLLHDVGSLGNSTCSVNHVIDDDNILVLYITDNLHAGNHVSASTSLVAKNERATEVLSISIGTLRTTYVWRSNYHILETQALQVRQDDTRCIEVIYWNIEEALNLIGMEVHGDEAVDTCYAEQVGNQFCTDADTWFVLTVLASPTEVRHNSDNVTSRCTLGSINHQEQLHQVV